VVVACERHICAKNNKALWDGVCLVFARWVQWGQWSDTALVNINASYIEAPLCKKLIRSKI
jgi:hypothetical protein